jgi:hypothetical protein
VRSGSRAEHRLPAGEPGPPVVQMEELQGAPPHHPAGIREMQSFPSTTAGGGAGERAHSSDL